MVPVKCNIKCSIDSVSLLIYVSTQQKVLRMDSPTADDDSAGEGADSREKFVLSVDIGTTSLRSHVYTKQGNIKGASSKRVSKLSEAMLKIPILINYLTCVISL